MPATKKLDNQTETQVVAMLARGDKHQVIVDWLAKDKGIDLSIKTVSLIKERNKQTLNFMKTELAKHEMTHSQSLLQKSRRLIDKKLDKALSLEDDLKVLQQRYDANEINESDYWNYRDAIMRQGISLKELTSVAKETFNQSQIEAGKPTSITETPEQAKENLKTLLSAINNQDPQAMLKAIFPDA